MHSALALSKCVSASSNMYTEPDETMANVRSSTLLVAGHRRLAYVAGCKYIRSLWEAMKVPNKQSSQRAKVTCTRNLGQMKLNFII